DAGKLQLESLSERFDEKCFTQPRHAFEQDMASREHPKEDAGDDLAMTDDDLLDLAAQRVERGHDLLDPRVLAHQPLLSDRLLGRPSPDSIERCNSLATNRSAWL